MIFVRLAGCSVGCDFCDTNYSVSERLSVEQIGKRVAALQGPSVEWVWITGGEPTDHDLDELLSVLFESNRLQVALATAGTRPVEYPVDFLSVSPHDPGKWVQRKGEQLNLVPGLNGFHLADFADVVKECEQNFSHRYVTPLEYRGKLEYVQECLDWVYSHKGWRMGVQGHKLWGVA